jgi:hypothetical protein
MCVGGCFEWRHPLLPGIHKVKIVARSEGYWIVEAQEDFEDTVGDQKTTVKKGEQRILIPNLLLKSKTFAPPLKPNSYELKVEKKVKHTVKEAEKRKTEASQTA